MSTSKILEGTCAVCGEHVFSTDLFTEERGAIFHLRCYNKLKAEEKVEDHE